MKRYKWRNPIALVLAFTFTLLAVTKATAYNVPAILWRLPFTEIRGVWLTNVDSDIYFVPDELKKAINRLDKLNFNTLYPTVWQEGYTLYPSAVSQRVSGVAMDKTPELEGRDVLKEIIDLGHKKGMSVMPWFEFGFMSSPDSDLVKKHPDWVTQRRDGKKIWQEGIHDRVWLNPFHPEVQKFILDLVLEIITKYDVEGIQFDDHFSLPTEFGYDSYTVAMYQKDLKSPPSDNFQESYWVRWRADRFNEFVEKLFRAIKAKKQKCIISLSPNPLHFSLPVHIQDWFTWERRGYIEELILQVYREDIKRFMTELDREELKLARTHIPVAIGILTGLKDNPMSSKNIEAQVQEVRRRGLSGVSFFFYESLSRWAKETPQERDMMIQRLFPKSIRRPTVKL
jgi:uncharacterized lipoprotein YddW (UPF0748 family)